MSVRMQTLVTVSAVLLPACLAVAQMPHLTPFSADMQMTSTREHQNMHGKIYLGGTRMRIEMANPEQESIVINDMANKTTDVLLPPQHMYMEFKGENMLHRGPDLSDLKPVVDPNNPCSRQEGSTCKKIGVETVNGRTCDHWHVTDKNGKAGDLWIDQKLLFPVRGVDKDTTWNLTNIREGEPSASLFVIPPGYQKMDMGSMMQRGKPPQQ